MDLFQCAANVAERGLWIGLKIIVHLIAAQHQQLGRLRQVDSTTHEVGE